MDGSCGFVVADRLRHVMQVGDVDPSFGCLQEDLILDYPCLLPALFDPSSSPDVHDQFSFNLLLNGAVEPDPLLRIEDTAHEIWHSATHDATFCNPVDHLPVRLRRCT